MLYRELEQHDVLISTDESSVWMVLRRLPGKTWWVGLHNGNVVETDASDVVIYDFIVLRGTEELID